MRNIYSTSIL